MFQVLHRNVLCAVVIANVAASLSSHDISPFWLSLAESTNWAIELCIRSEDLRSTQHPRKCPQRSPKVIAFAPAQDPERLETADHLGIGGQGQRRIDGANQDDAELQVIGQELEQVQGGTAVDSCPQQSDALRREPACAARSSAAARAPGARVPTGWRSRCVVYRHEPQGA